MTQRTRTTVAVDTGADAKRHVGRQKIRFVGLDAAHPPGLGVGKRRRQSDIDTRASNRGFHARHFIGVAGAPELPSVLQCSENYVT